MQPDLTFSGLNIYPVVILIPFVILLPVYLFAEKRGDFKQATALKLTLSAMCTLSALLGFAASGGADVWRILVVFALAAAIFGDYYLQYIRLDMQKFIRGVLCFAITQVLLIIFLIIEYGISWQEFVITAIVVVLVLILMRKQDWQLGRAQLPLSAYTLLLSFMAAKAVCALFSAPVTGAMVCMAAGGVLFLVSDLFLGIWNYRTNKMSHAFWNWITYFSGIMLISLSNYPLFA